MVVAEEFIDFSRELSVLVVRRPGGPGGGVPGQRDRADRRHLRGHHHPAPGLRPDQVRDLQAMALRIAGELGVVGILAVELMQARDGRIVVNELAMRPHNTGHWSIDGAVTSQFENHLRAVADLPLGSTAVTGRVLGDGERARRTPAADLLAAWWTCSPPIRGLKVQLYGKDVVPGRKVGHVTAVRGRRRGHQRAGLASGREVPDGRRADE